MVKSPDDRQVQPAWTRLEHVSYSVSVTALLLGAVTLMWTIETDRRPIALAILVLGIAVVFALIGYAVRRVLRER
jgi:hypothetical protein